MVSPMHVWLVRLVATGECKFGRTIRVLLPLSSVCFLIALRFVVINSEKVRVFTVNTHMRVANLSTLKQRLNFYIKMQLLSLFPLFLILNSIIPVQFGVTNSPSGAIMKLFYDPYPYFHTPGNVDLIGKRNYTPFRFINVRQSSPPYNVLSLCRFSFIFHIHFKQIYKCLFTLHFRLIESNVIIELMLCFLLSFSAMNGCICCNSVYFQRL